MNEECINKRCWLDLAFCTSLLRKKYYLFCSSIDWILKLRMCIEDMNCKLFFLIWFFYDDASSSLLFYKYFISLAIKLNRVLLFRQVHAFLHLNCLHMVTFLSNINMFYKTRQWIFFLEKSRRHYSSAWNIYSLSIIVILYFFTFYAHLIYFFDMIWYGGGVCACAM